MPNNRGMKRSPLLLLLVFSLALLPSCEKILFEDDLGSTDPFVNFDYLWSEVDAKYSYFSLKEIDWDAARDSFRTQLEPGMSEEALFATLAEMLNVLRDDHVNLVAPFNTSRYNVALRNPANYLARTVEEHYIPNGRITGAFVHDILPGHNVGYVRYASFARNVNRSAMDHILLRYRNTNGIILDMRENGGGSLSNVFRILAHFTNERRLVAFSKTRNGPGRDDFGAETEIFVNPTEGVRFLKPVVMLTDRGSYSATTFFALAAKSIPNIILLGDTTGGGGGLPNGGQLPNGWSYRFSITQLLDVDGNNFAESGVPPDFQAAFDWGDLSNDEIIEAAIALLE